MSEHLKIRVTRDIYLPACTLGVVELDRASYGQGWLPFGFALEDTDRRLEEDITRKVRGATAIPCGVYRVHLYDSPKHGPQTPELIGVPGFSHCQLHPGNDEGDTEGCLLFGLGRDIVAGTISRSKVACTWLRKEIIGVINCGGSVTVEVRRADSD